MIIPFDSPHATLATVGGKGANLARLTRAAFPVPGGFLIPTNAYRAFVHTNSLEPVITATLATLAALPDPPDPAALETASAQIRAAFVVSPLPPTLAAEIQTAYLTLTHTHTQPTNQPSPSPIPNSQFLIPNSPFPLPFSPVAVRSSATAEDLPDLSFAGQQDTYLNVLGPEQLLDAVRACWGSLWTARAIGYRMRNDIPHEETALAVVVQTMVPSEVSGVLFTANPLTGALDETVIDATFGLGEALVSGQVEPDHFVVSQSGDIKSITLGAKGIATRSKAGGGVETLTESGAGQQTLPETTLRQLTALGQQIQHEYHAPQDIEWALANGQLFILQARAITSLFPVPEVSFDPLIVWFSFAAVQGVMGPITPLGQDALQHVIGGAGKMFGLSQKPENIHVFEVGGERLWVRISDLMRNPVGKKVVDFFLEYIDPSARQIVQTLARDPRLGADRGTLKVNTLFRVIRFAIPVVARMARNMLRPEAGRARFDQATESYLATAHLPPNPDPYARLAQVIAFLRDRIANAFPFLLPQFIPLFGPSMAGLNALTHLSGDPSLALEVTRGLPHNVTTEMDLALWDTAKALRADAATRELVANTPASELATLYLHGQLPSPAQTALAQFLTPYGMRGIAEIDFGQPRWRENPTPVIHTLQSYLQIPPDAAPDVLFAKGEQAAHAALEKIAAQVRQQPFGWLKEKLVRAFARRIRVLMGARESPKFFAIRTMGIARQALLEIGQALVKAGALEQAGDLVFLHLNELEHLAKTRERYPSLITERRAVYAREARRKQIPRILVSDGRAFYEGVGAQTDTGDTLTGSPVSPGVVEGVVHVVFDPRTTQLAPGEILVCPGTDPAWTPLFLSAGGLVMEVGGMMTHGSVVAREYGIPAVVGVHEATSRLKDGQRIRVDGTSGKIVVIE
jgi:pyruvate,water dikinase